MSRDFEIAKETTGVDTTFTTVGTQTGLDHGKNAIALEVENVSEGGHDQVLSDFKCQLKDHVDGEWYDWISGASWTAGVIPNIEFCTTQGPQDLPHTTLAHVHLRIPPVYGIRLQAKTAANSATVKTKFSIDAM